MLSESDLVSKPKKKEHHVKGTTNTVILNTHHTCIGLRARGWGGTLLLRGTCHMLSESGLKQKAIKCKQDSQAARQPDPPKSGGGEAEAVGRLMCVFLQACACVVFLLNEETVAVATSEQTYGLVL